MLEQSLLILSVAALIAGVVAAAVFPLHAMTLPTRRPSATALPATQTADIDARAGADPAARM